MENYVCSVELAKRIKELGINIKTTYYWRPIGDKYILIDSTYFDTQEDDIPAPCVGELGEMLPKVITINGLHYFWKEIKLLNKFRVRYECLGGNPTIATEKPKDIYSDDKLESNARAKLLIYLYENKLI